MSAHNMNESFKNKTVYHNKKPPLGRSLIFANRRERQCVVYYATQRSVGRHKTFGTLGVSEKIRQPKKNASLDRIYGLAETYWICEERSKYERKWRSPAPAAAADFRHGSRRQGGTTQNRTQPKISNVIKAVSFTNGEGLRKATEI